MLDTPMFATVCILAAALMIASLSGCAVRREARHVVAPSYSHMRSADGTVVRGEFAEVRDESLASSARR